MFPAYWWKHLIPSDYDCLYLLSVFNQFTEFCFTNTLLTELKSHYLNIMVQCFNVSIYSQQFQALTIALSLLSCASSPLAWTVQLHGTSIFQPSRIPQHLKYKQVNNYTYRLNPKISLASLIFLNVPKWIRSEKTVTWLWYLKLQ